MNRAETYLQESGESKRSLSSAYAALFHEHPQPMWMWSYATRRVCAANPALLSLLGYPQDRPGTVDIGRILPEQSAALLETLRADDPLPHVHHVALCGADERIRDFEASFRTVDDPETATRYVLAIVNGRRTENTNPASAGEGAGLTGNIVIDNRGAPPSGGGREHVNRRLSFLL